MRYYGDVVTVICDAKFGMLSIKTQTYRYIQKYQTQLYICRSTTFMYQVFVVVCADMHMNPAYL